MGILILYDNFNNANSFPDTPAKIEILIFRSILFINSLGNVLILLFSQALYERLI